MASHDWLADAVAATLATPQWQMFVRFTLPDLAARVGRLTTEMIALAAPTSSAVRHYRVQVPPRLYERLNVLATDLGYEVEVGVGRVEGDPETVLATVVAESGRIMIKEALPRRTPRELVLAHELGHIILGHGVSSTIGDVASNEREAEEVGFVACAAAGMSVEAQCVAHLALWSAGDPEGLGPLTPQVHRAADVILAGG